MRQIQVVLNAAGQKYDDVRESVRIASRQSGAVDVWGASEDTMRRLISEFGGRVGRAEEIRKRMDVAVVGVEIRMASNTLALLQKQLERFLLVRVFDSSLAWNSLAVWSSAAFENQQVSVDELIHASADFDRRLLPTDSGTARLWVQGVDFGVRNTDTAESENGLAARMAGTQLRLANVLKSLRGLLGRAKRNRESKRLRRRFYQTPR